MAGVEFFPDLLDEVSREQLNNCIQTFNNKHTNKQSML